MELRQLHHFVTVVEKGSLGRAAKELNISEPALSKSIRRLEERLDVKLLDRGSRGMTPTSFGDTLMTHARFIRSQFDHALSEIDELRGVSKGIIRIGARPSFGAVILPKVVARVQQDRPGVRVLVREGMMSNMISEVIHGDLDFIVVTLSEESPDPNLIQEPLIASPVGLFVRNGHPLVGKEMIGAHQISDYPWILPLGSDPVRQQLEQMLKESGIESFHVAAESDSVLFIMSYLQNTDAIGFFPGSMIDQFYEKSRFARLNVKGMEWQRELGIVRRNHVSLSPAAQFLVQELKKELRTAGLQTEY